MQVKIQEYIRNEKYYIIKTEEKNQYIGVSYNSYNDSIRFQRFEPLEPNTEYLQPDTKRTFSLLRKEVKTLMRTMSMLWNRKDENMGMVDRSFGIRNYGDYSIQAALLKDNTDHILYIVRINREILPIESFSISLGYNNSRSLYSILNRILKENPEIKETRRYA